MLKDLPDRACFFVAVDYEPEIGYSRTIIDAAEAIQSKLRSRTWGTIQNGFFFRVVEKRLFFTVDLKRLYVQGIGILAWQTSLNDHGNMIRSALERLGVKTLKRVGFQTLGFFQTGMTHAEMADLMYGCFLPPPAELDGLCGKPEDALVQLHGEKDNMKLRLVMAPMNAEQSAAQVSLIPNPEAFLEPKFFDSTLKEFKERVVGDCFYIDTEFVRTDIPCADVASFFKDAFAAADSTTTAAVQRLKGFRGKKGGRK
jgi:hypothetical protein